MAGQKSNEMWGGRFAEGPDAIMRAINASIGFDRRLASQDIAGSLAHVDMLGATGIVDEADAKQIKAGLETVLREIQSGDFSFSEALEDIHMNVEARLRDLIGPAAGRLHTARSRNDQVATDFSYGCVISWMAQMRRSRAVAGTFGASRKGCGLGYAGVYPSTKCSARHLGASYDGLCRNVSPRPRSDQGCAQTYERVPLAQRRLQGRHFRLIAT